MSDEPTKLAQEIKVVRRGGRTSITIDGHPFPWYIARNGIECTIEPDSPGTVRLTILADRVVVDNDAQSANR